MFSYVISESQVCVGVGLLLPDACFKGGVLEFAGGGEREVGLPKTSRPKGNSFPVTIVRFHLIC